MRPQVNIDVKDALAVQQAVDKVVQGVGVRFSSINQGFTQPMARVTVSVPEEGGDGSLGLHIVPMGLDDRDFIGVPLEEMETIGSNDQGLRFVCKGWEYTIYPLGDVAPALLEAGRTYESRVAQAKRDDAETYRRFAEQSQKGAQE